MTIKKVSRAEFESFAPERINVAALAEYAVEFYIADGPTQLGVLERHPKCWGYTISMADGMLDVGEIESEDEARRALLAEMESLGKC